MRISDWSADVCSSDLRAYDVHGCVLAGAGHATSAYAEVARRRRRQVAALATRPAVLGPCRFGTPRLLPVGTSERELRDIAFAQLGLDPADAAVVEIAGHLVGQPRPGRVDDDGVVQPDRKSTRLNSSH